MSSSWLEAALARRGLDSHATRFLAAGLLVTLTLVSASTESAASPASPDSSVSTQAPTFQLDELRAASPIAAYKLERAYYDHLLEVAVSLARSKDSKDFKVSKDSTPTIDGLPEPTRPTLNLDVSATPHTGGKEAEVSVVVVESLTQVYARRLAPRLEALLRRYGDRLALRSFTVAGRSNRGSGPAAVAAHCAGIQGRFWDFRSLILADAHDGARSKHLAFATRLELDTDRFSTCLNSKGIAAEIVERSAVARGLGMTTTPVVLVNGVYVGGAEPRGVLEAEVRRALGSSAQGFSDPGPSVPDTTSQEAGEIRIDWRLTGVLLMPGSSQAVFVHRTDPRSSILTEGDVLEAEISVTEIRADHVLVRTPSGPGRVSLESAASSASKGARPAEPASLEGRPDYASMSDRALVRENVSVLRLDRSLRRRIVARRTELESQFSPVSLEVEGKKLLKLTGDEHGGLLASLGLHENDVIMRVNDAWVWDGNNTLFGQIERSLPVTVVIMRKGYPRLIELVEGGG
jgi:protein-disulfide isomerase